MLDSSDSALVWISTVSGWGLEDRHDHHAARGTGEQGPTRGAIGLVGSIVVGIASTAPAYSLAASLGYVVIVENGDGIVGMKAPLIMVLAFIPMYFIAVAYSELNKAEPDCGTTFTWAARAFGTRTGWMGGWGIIAADVIVMANLSQIAGSYSFALFGFDDLATSTFWSTVAGIIWIIDHDLHLLPRHRGLGAVAVRPARRRGRHAGGLRAVRVGEGLLRGRPGAIKPSLTWLSPSGLSLTAIVSATLIAVFIYWGWDTAVATNEEADDPSTTPGRAAVISTVLLLLTYALVSVATIAFAGVGAKGIGLGNVDNADDVFAAMGHEVFGGGAVGWIMVHLLAICVLTSASASTQTTILPTARTSLSMAAFKAVPSRFARIHPKYLTPSDSTIWMGGVSIIFYVGLTLLSVEHPGRHDRRGRVDDRLLLRAHRLRVHLVLPQDDVEQAARHPDAGRPAAARRHPAPGLLRRSPARPTGIPTTATRASAPSVACS